jgi:hypothetical protein
MDRKARDSSEKIWKDGYFSLVEQQNLGISMDFIHFILFWVGNQRDLYGDFSTHR